MSPSIRRMLWGAFVGLALLTVIAVVFTITVLQMQKDQETVAQEQYRPLLDAVRQMDTSLVTTVSAARGYLLNRESAFQQQHDDAARAFDKAFSQASQTATDEGDKKTLAAFNEHYTTVKRLNESQIA